MLQQTSLTAKHIELNATMAEFGGFEMPIQYGSVKAEIQAVRNEVGIFDVSHMGEFFCEGPDAVAFVDYLVTNDFKNSPVGKAVYSPLCREDGTVIDDLIAYKLQEDKVLICVNASNIQKDWDWISAKHQETTDKFKLDLNNCSEDYSLIAVQGPKSEKALSDLGLEVKDLPYYAAVEQGDVILARTGYTGEDGFEVFASHSKINELWQQLVTNGAVPCGLAARDVLRLEVCYPLYGHEINDELTPLDAALKWTVKLGKESFIGKDALANYKPQKRLVKLSLEKGIPRDGYQVLNDKMEQVGVVTSGSMSVTLGKGIAIALIEKELFPENKKFYIQVRNKQVEAKYHTKAFVVGGHK